MRNTEEDTRGGEGAAGARPPFLRLSKFFFSEQLALSATTTTTTTITTTTTTTTIQYYWRHGSKWCPTPFILTIDLLFSLKFSKFSE